MTTDLSKSSKRQFLIHVSGISGYFATKTGGEVSADVSRVYDGGAKKPDILPGPAQASDIVITRPYSRRRDGITIRNLLQQVGSWRTTVSITPTDVDLVAETELARVFSNALLIGCSDPEADSGSSDAAMWQLTFAVPNWR